MFGNRGFLPELDPAAQLCYYPSNILDDVGRDLPSLLEDKSFRQYVRELKIPHWQEDHRYYQDKHLKLYYLRLAFIASAYINQLGQPRETLLPANIAVPLCQVCKILDRPPVLSYDGYALYNWKRFIPEGNVELGNIDTIQNFVHLYDEHWFILIHVEIEAIGAVILQAAASIAAEPTNESIVNSALSDIAAAVWKQVSVLRRIPEKMDPALYYKTFRQYIRFFENVVYQGVQAEPTNYRGETGAQSSLLPALVALMKVNHKQSVLTNHLADMKNYMPADHRKILIEIQSISDFRNIADKQIYNDVLEGMATFREVHFGWAQEYINKWESDPRGTGGTPYMEWLGQLINETREHKIQ